MCVVLLAFAWPTATSRVQNLPVAVVGLQEQVDAVTQKMPEYLLELHPVASREDAVNGITSREVCGGIVLGHHTTESALRSAEGRGCRRERPRDRSGHSTFGSLYIMYIIGHRDTSAATLYGANLIRPLRCLRWPRVDTQPRISPARVTTGRNAARCLLHDAPHDDMDQRIGTCAA